MNKCIGILQASEVEGVGRDVGEDGVEIIGEDKDYEYYYEYVPIKSEGEGEGELDLEKMSQEEILIALGLAREKEWWEKDPAMAKAAMWGIYLGATVLGIGGGILVSNKMSKSSPREASFPLTEAAIQISTRRGAYVFASKALLAGTLVCGCLAYLTRLATYSYMKVHNIEEFAAEVRRRMSEKQLKKRIEEKSEPARKIYYRFGGWVKSLSWVPKLPEETALEENESPRGLFLRPLEGEEKVQLPERKSNK